jgi:hypothetical protein
MLSQDTKISIQVEKLSPVQKAALIIYCAVPSLTRTVELDQVLKGLRDSHQKLFSVSSLTEHGAEWAYEASRQLFPPDYVAIEKDAEDEIDSFASDGLPLFGKLLEMISSDTNELDEGDEYLDGDDIDQLIFQGNSSNFEEEIVQQASRYRVMMRKKYGVHVGRFPEIQDKSPQVKKSPVSNQDPIIGASFQTYPTSADKPEHRTMLGEDFVPAKTTHQSDVSNTEYKHSLREIFEILAKSYGIVTPPKKTSQFITTVQKDPDLANAKCSISRNSYGLIIKIRDQESTKSEIQIMLASDGKILNTYGLENHDTSKDTAW